MAYDKMVDSTQLDGAMTATANAIRARTGSSDAIAWNADTGFKDAIEHLDDWHKPAGWPDIEQLPLPSGDESCVYFLYDCEADVKYAAFTHNVGSSKYTLVDLTVATYKNGVISEFADTDVTKTATNVYIPLPDDCKYAVVRLQNYGTRFTFALNSNLGIYYLENNVGSNQNCLWMYGKLYSDTQIDMYMNQTGGISSIYMERAKLYISPTITLGYGLKASRNLHSVIINDGNFNNNGGFWSGSSCGISLTGDFVAKNTYVSAGRMPVISARNINIDGLATESGTISGQGAFQNARNTESISMRTNSLKLTSMQNMFENCIMLSSLDMTGCNLSECTNYSGAFTACRTLKNLILGENISVSISVAGMPSLTHDSLVNGVIAKLATVNESQTLTLGNILMHKLSADEIAVATAKGWSVA